MVDCSPVFFVLWLTTSVAAEASSDCSIVVQPKAAVVVVGENVSLQCTTSEKFSIMSWQMGQDIPKRKVVYTAPIYGKNGTINRSGHVVDDYYVTNTSESNISLHINNVTLSKAGLYACQCRDTKQSVATTSVVVLASEPNISVSFNADSWETVNVNCTISFNGSSTGVSLELTIKDISGSTVNRAVCNSNNDLTLCNLSHTIMANTSANQSYSCSVNLTINNSTTVYSRTVNTTLKLQRVFSATIEATNQDKCSTERCAVGEKLVCKTNGTSRVTAYQWWQILNNGSESQITGDGRQYLVLNAVGRFTYRCQVYSGILGVIHNSVSATFTVNVTEDQKNRNEELPFEFVMTISVGIGVIVIVIAVVVICILCCPKQKKRSFRSPSTDESSITPPRPPANRYDKTNVQNRLQQSPAATASNQPAVSRDDKRSIGNDLVVFDNDLYEGARNGPAKSADPSDGYKVDEVIYNEIQNI